MKRIKINGHTYYKVKSKSGESFISPYKKQALLFYYGFGKDWASETRYFVSGKKIKAIENCKEINNV